MQEEKMDISLSKELTIPKNLINRDNEYFEQYAGTDKDSDNWRMESDYILEVIEISDQGDILFGLSSDLGYQSFNYTPKQVDLITLVENQESLSGDLMVESVQLITKKLNKFKTLIESIKNI